MPRKSTLPVVASRVTPEAVTAPLKEAPPESRTVIDPLPVKPPTLIWPLATDPLSSVSAKPWLETVPTVRSALAPEPVSRVTAEASVTLPSVMGRSVALMVPAKRTEPVTAVPVMPPAKVATSSAASPRVRLPTFRKVVADPVSVTVRSSPKVRSKVLLAVVNVPVVTSAWNRMVPAVSVSTRPEALTVDWKVAPPVWVRVSVPKSVPTEPAKVTDPVELTIRLDAVPPSVPLIAPRLMVPPPPAPSVRLTLSARVTAPRVVAAPVAPVLISRSPVTVTGALKLTATLEVTMSPARLLDPGPLWVTAPAAVMSPPEPVVNRPVLLITTVPPAVVVSAAFRVSALPVKAKLPARFTAPDSVVVPVPEDWVRLPASMVLEAVTLPAAMMVIASNGLAPVPTAPPRVMEPVPAFSVRSRPEPVMAPKVIAPPEVATVESALSSVAPSARAAPLVRRMPLLR